MTGQQAAGATITVTMRDGRQVTAITWNACTGVGAFVASLLGQPAATHTATLKEEELCP
ncbi:hypothetical protein ACBJ59_12300 [Nonomuraea sp. MTCD27]|uniref:hypothetical protein n=1 Tax=Nonomuraea sp. MTCD27 TaxID=1676747 RepID=UPI0035C16986